MFRDLLEVKIVESVLEERSAPDAIVYSGHNSVTKAEGFDLAMIGGWKFVTPTRDGATVLIVQNASSLQAPVRKPLARVGAYIVGEYRAEKEDYDGDRQVRRPSPDTPEYILDIDGKLDPADKGIDFNVAGDYAFVTAQKKPSFPALFVTPGRATRYPGAKKIAQVGDFLVFKAMIDSNADLD